MKLVTVEFRTPMILISFLLDIVMLIGQVMLNVEKVPQMDVSSKETNSFHVLVKSKIVFLYPLSKLNKFLLETFVLNSC